MMCTPPLAFSSFAIFIEKVYLNHDDLLICTVTLGKRSFDFLTPAHIAKVKWVFNMKPGKSDLFVYPFVSNHQSSCPFVLFSGSSESPFLGHTHLVLHSVPRRHSHTRNCFQSSCERYVLYLTLFHALFHSEQSSTSSPFIRHSVSSKPKSCEVKLLKSLSTLIFVFICSWSLSLLLFHVSLYFDTAVTYQIHKYTVSQQNFHSLNDIFSVLTATAHFLPELLRYCSPISSIRRSLHESIILFTVLEKQTSNANTTQFVSSLFTTLSPRSCSRYRLWNPIQHPNCEFKRLSRTTWTGRILGSSLCFCF